MEVGVLQLNQGFTANQWKTIPLDETPTAQQDGVYDIAGVIYAKTEHIETRVNAALTVNGQRTAVGSTRTTTTLRDIPEEILQRLKVFTADAGWAGVYPHRSLELKKGDQIGLAVRSESYITVLAFETGIDSRYIK